MSVDDSTESYLHVDSGPLALEATTGEGPILTPLTGGAEFVIGRSRGCALRLEDASVSRQHARVRVGPDVVSVEELGSHNGTWVRGEKLAPGHIAHIAVGEIFQIGAIEVRLVRADAVPPPRRVWPHGYFEGRLEEECARARRKGGGFALLRLSAPDAAPALCHEALGATLRAHDVLGSYAAGEHEALLVEATPAQAETAVARLLERLRGRGVSARAVLACFPRDGVSAGEILARANALLRGATAAADAFGGQASASPAMRRVLELAEQVAPSMVSVLIMGETGVGKEVCAETIHRRSPRAARTFLKLHCAALPDALIESELFGHEKGAFTGAAATTPGLIESADGGTVFLDEIGELPRATQVKLLRVLDAREVMRLGGRAPIKVDVRFVAATNRSLEAEVAAGRFRQDLYFRLAGMVLSIPPLRERVEEILPLARRFAEEAGVHAGYGAPEISPAAATQLERYAWPGNIRELRNAMERAVLVSAGKPIEPAHLPLEKFSTLAANASPAGREFDAPELTGPVARVPAALYDEVEALEKQRVLAALAAAGGNQSEAARRLGMSRGALLARLRAWGITKGK